MNILIVAAHPDDEILGCGGTIARHADEGDDVHVLFLADGTSSRDEKSESLRLMREEAAIHACTAVGATAPVFLGFPDNAMDTVPLLEVIRAVESEIWKVEPSIIYTHHEGDLNIDHQVAHQAVATACRPQPGFPVRELLFFEVPSSTEWHPPESAQIFAPNMFVDISLTLKTKMEALRAYADELREFPHPRSIRAVEALALWRGASIGVDAAEAFVMGRKLI